MGISTNSLIKNSFKGTILLRIFEGADFELDKRKTITKKQKQKQNNNNKKKNQQKRKR